MEPLRTDVRGGDQEEARSTASIIFPLAMAKFRSAKSLQKFASIHSSVHNYFNQERHLNRRDIFNQNRSAALAEWRQLAA